MKGKIAWLVIEDGGITPTILYTKPTWYGFGVKIIQIVYFEVE